jgi:predicted DNA binding CopG/RHH family protein
MPEKRKELPEFATEEEEAEFRDTHSVADHRDQFEREEVELDPELAARIAGRSKTRRVTLRLRASRIEAAREIAKKKDIPYQTLMRSWIAQGIERERAGGER